MNKYDKSDEIRSKTIITEMNSNNVIRLDDTFATQYINSSGLVKITNSSYLSKSERQASYEKLSFNFFSNKLM
ncbi:hypothetical protein [Clostridium pasteurianum]|uniref:Uncharacterized protein n=1 Tax=Clostridium pasteurianum BC1 TaxID=86416 RepID=R4KAQ4_CLOPA|nr:hypothetical protein [Clostridium pasteurianum]AGK96720.1 hypothetical protein Clopa_1817 [Clostridium pasteurianum BC1]